MNYNINIITGELLENQNLALELHVHKNRLIYRFKTLQMRLGDEENLLLDSTKQDEQAVQ